MQVELLTVCVDNLEETATMFNDYVEYTLATWTETPVSVERFEKQMRFTLGYPALAAYDDEGVLA